MEEKIKRRFYIRIVYTALKYAIYVLLAFLVRGFIQFGASEIAGEGSFDQLVLEWITLGTCFLAYFTLTRVFVLLDRTYRETFFEGEEKRLSIVKKGKFILLTPDFWIEILITYALVAIMPFQFGYTALINTLSFYITISYTMTKLYVVLIAFPLLFLLNLLAYFSSLNWWVANYQREKKSAKEGHLFKHLISIFLIYCAASLIIPILLSVIVTFANILGNLTTIILLVSLFILLTVLCYSRAFLLRKKFLRKLKRICNDKDYQISKIKAGYLSIFRFPQGSSFTIFKDEKVYECKLICGVRKSTPMFLDCEGNGKNIHTVRIGKLELFHFVTFFQYGFETQHEKIIIVNPVPLQVSKTGEGRSKEIDTGEKIGKYHVYNSTGFLGALERNCLGR